MVEGSGLIGVGARGGDRSRAAFDRDLKLLANAEDGICVQTVGGVEFVERDIRALGDRPEIIAFFNRVSLKGSTLDLHGLIFNGEGGDRLNRRHVVKLAEIIALCRETCILKTSIEGGTEA